MASPTTPAEPDLPSGRDEGALRDVPDVGQIVHRLRTRRGMHLREVAAGSGLSASFLSALERGESDISLGRLAQLARFFGLDVGSLLGYERVRARPHFVRDEERQRVDRGDGVSYEVLHLPGADIELIMIEIAARSGFAQELTHEGVDAVYVTEGEAILTVSGVDFPMAAGECAVFSGGYRHRMRNDSDAPAKAISVVTERIF